MTIAVSGSFEGPSLENLMAAWSRIFIAFVQRRRRLVRGLLALAAIAFLIDGFMIERSILHLLLLHPLLLLALLDGLILTETPDPQDPPDGH